MALLCAFVITASAQTVLSEDNYDTNGDTIAKSLGDFSIDGLTQNVSYFDITYTATNGETKTGKMYFVTNLWGSYRQQHSTYLPADFDMSQMVYMPDKIDVNGDGSFAENEKIKGTQGDKNLYYKCDGFVDGTFTNTESVKNQLTQLCYSAYLEYFGPDAYGKVPLTTLTYSGREAVEGTFFVSPKINQFYGGNNGSSFGGSANGNINGDTCKFTRLVFEEREGAVSFAQYSLCRNVIEEVVFLGGTYYLRDDAIAYLWTEGTNTPCLKRVVVSDGVSFTGSIALNVGNYDIVYIGNEGEYVAGNYSSALKNATGTVHYETLCYVYGHNPEQGDNDCTTERVCADCSEIVEEAFATHNLGSVNTCLEDASCQREGCNFTVTASASHKAKKVLVYENGFGAEGVYSCICENADYCTAIEGYAVEESTNPIITFKGYSRALSNAYIGIDAGYKVDKDLLALYNEVNATDATLSLFMVNSKYGEVNISKIFKDGTLELETNVKGINVSITSTNYTDISVSVKGFDNANETGSFYTLALISAIAVKTEAGVHYIQAGLKNSPNTTITVEGVDFNIVTANNVYNPTGA